MALLTGKTKKALRESAEVSETVRDTAVAATDAVQEEATASEDAAPEVRSFNIDDAEHPVDGEHHDTELHLNASQTKPSEETAVDEKDETAPEQGIADASDGKPVLYVKYLEVMPEELAYATDGSAGIDLRVCLEGCKSRGTRLAKGVVRMLRTGVAVAIPEGYVGLVCMRSGKSAREGLRLANQLAVIDSDYRGEVMLPLTSTLSAGTYIENFERVAQLVILPVAMCNIVHDKTASMNAEGNVLDSRSCGQKREFIGEFILRNDGRVAIMAAEELPATTRGINGFGSTGK